MANAPRTLLIETEDAPGVLSRVSGILGQNGISISSVLQRDRGEGKTTAIVIVTHHAREKMMQQAVSELKKLSVVRGTPHMIRIESGL